MDGSPVYDSTQAASTQSFEHNSGSFNTKLNFVDLFSQKFNVTSPINLACICY